MNAENEWMSGNEGKFRSLLFVNSSIILKSVN